MQNSEINPTNVETTNVETAKVETAKVKKVKKEKTVKEKKQDSKNLANLLDKISTSNNTTQSGTGRSGLFKDKKYLQDFDGGKKYRTTKRNELRKLMNNIVIKLKAGENCIFKKEITQSKLHFIEAKKEFSIFVAHYKEFYSVNDFTVRSLYEGKETNTMYIVVQSFLEVIQQAKKENKL